ncbi:MAG: adenosine deaminase [Chloroflexota bacterium]
MNNANLLTGCELHLHVLGAFYAEDIFELGKDHYQSIDWDQWGFVDAYEGAFCSRPDPIKIFEDALHDKQAGFERFKKLHVYSEEDGGDFGRWEVKGKFGSSVWTHYRKMGESGDRMLMERMLTTHRTQGLDYVEYRCGSGLDGWLYWHRICAEMLQAASDDGFTARYILSIPRYAPMEAYELTQTLLDDNPELAPTIVGVDFATMEEGFPPKNFKPFFDAVAKGNQDKPERALDIVYHVGESYFDKSLESASRWCHEIAEMGAKRIAHAIALGLDPAVAIARRPHAHELELVSERLDQIEYDLHHQDRLAAYGIEIDIASLTDEKGALLKMAPEDKVDRPYDENRLEQVRRRQTFVLDRLVELGTVIEVCPTSNLRIGGVPDPSAHPIHRFLKSNVNLIISSDDPGNFDITQASEIEWVLNHTDMTLDDLEKRLGDPRRFRLGQNRDSSHMG